MALLLFMWPIGGIVGAIVGQSLNRTREGAILGFVLGFIGVVIVVCMDRKPAPESPLPPAGWRLTGAAERPVTSSQ
jgi:predicted branched-subunit amino acid permease